MKRSAAAFLLITLAFRLFPEDPLSKRLGQLFLINVDGFRYSGKWAVHPAYMKLAGEVNAGGVLPHYNTCDWERIRSTNRELEKAAGDDLLIASDQLKVCGLPEAFGDGYAGGLIRKFRHTSDQAFADLAVINAFLHKAQGINLCLGPVIDASAAAELPVSRVEAIMAAYRMFGIGMVFKHYPYLPSGFSLHNTLEDQPLPEGEVSALTSRFSRFCGGNGWVMTTHVLNSMVDAFHIVTFSEKWITRLKQTPGCPGLVMTDGLLMLENYGPDFTEPVYLASAHSPGERAADWVIQAVMAGHDMVILEGASVGTREVFNRVLKYASQETIDARHFRKRIGESYARIQAYKKDNKQLFGGLRGVSDGQIRGIVRLLKAAGASGSWDESALSEISGKILNLGAHFSVSFGLKSKK